MTIKALRAALAVGLFSILYIATSATPIYAQAENLANIYKEAHESVVYVVSALPNGAASGSGFVFSSTGSSSTIITANHVIEGASRVDVILDSDPHKRYAATVVSRDHVRDVAVLTIQVGNRKALRLMDIKNVQEGSSVAVIGYPRAATQFEKVFGDDLRPSIHTGIISAVRLNGEIIQFDAETDHGDSGGPVIDATNGAVVAIVRGELLDQSYVSRGLEQALPGSAFGMSVLAINSTISGAPASRPLEIAAISDTATAATSAVPVHSVPTSGETNSASSAAFRVGYGAPHYANAGVEATSQSVLLRLSNYFQGQNAFYMIPVAFGTISQNGQNLSGLCDDNRLNAIVQPSVNWSFPRIYTATGAPAQIKATVSLLVTDCSGIAYFADVKTKTESTLFAKHRGDQEIVDMANDLLDQTLHDFDAFRAEHAPVWNTLLRTGIGLDPDDGRYHAMFGVTQDSETRAFRVYAVFTNGPAAKAGMQVGDVIQSINGTEVGGLDLKGLVDLLNTPTVSAVVNRPGGSVTLTIVPEKASTLISTLGR